MHVALIVTVIDRFSVICYLSAVLFLNNTAAMENDFLVCLGHALHVQIMCIALFTVLIILIV